MYVPKQAGIFNFKLYEHILKRYYSQKFQAASGSQQQ